MLRWLLKEGPKLESVRLGSRLESLVMLPDEMFLRVKLNGALNIRIRSPVELNLLRRIACAAGSRLHVIEIHPIPCYGGTHYFAYLEVADANNVLQFDRATERIIQMSHKSVRKTIIHGDYNVGGLYHPPLGKLSDLHVEQDDVHNVWGVIVGIDYPRKMPVLKEVKLELNRNYEPQFGDVMHSSTSVCMLEIESGDNQSNVWPLPRVFPNVSSLHFSNMVKDVFLHWCRLEQLTLWMNWRHIQKRLGFLWNFRGRSGNIKATRHCVSHECSHRSYQAMFSYNAE